MSDSPQPPPGESDEARLFEAIRFGDDDAVRDAVEELVRQNGSRLLDSLQRWGLTRAESQDVANTAWERAWTKIKCFEYRADGKFFAWLKSIARNVTRETFRKRYAAPDPSKAPAELDCDAATDTSADDGLVLMLRADFRAKVEAILADAPADYQTVIKAHFFNEADLSEIQERHGWTRTKVDVTKLRALAWLRKRLTDQYGERFVQDWLA